ncbi:MAG: DUF2249 domain-containing protein [Bacteroidetes bacterium]|nr:DUF2249 domain-containing protein [Bacteroidota bacterium]MBS1629463.1 DUF2249 domain-containing protein [Bacteroidota bacterium]
MTISEQTKIAVLLKHHPEALEAIVALSPDFKKLRNPVLRKLMAGRTSIAMAAKIGGCKPEDFGKALASFGFEWVSNKAEENIVNRKPLPEFLKDLKPEQLVVLDVRSMLAEGNDPLSLIQQTVKQLQTGQVLQIINTFEPVPLIKLLERQGFASHIDAISADHVETFFYKKSDDTAAPELVAAPTDASGWDELLTHFEGQLQPIDVRHLEMPQPMMQILEALEHLPEEKALYVQHKRIPVFLLTELKERHFDYRIKEVAEGEVYLLIFKKEEA